MHQLFELAGKFLVECRDPSGKLAWRDRINNGITLAALSDLESVYFNAGTQKTAWYLGLINATAFGSVSINDTMLTHAGWTELTTYVSATRPQYNTLNIVSGVMANLAPRTFTLNAAASMQGLFLASDSTRGGTAGLLWSTGLFLSPRNLASGQNLSVNYTLRASGGGG